VSSPSHPALELEVSVVIPCLDEEATIGTCVSKARSAFEKLHTAGEVIVVDNGSRDRSAAVAAAAGARVVSEPRRGYGQAYLAGFAAARGRFLVMGDADDTYDFADLAGFVQPLRQGSDMVMGTRLRGRIEPGAMPWHHRWIGVPILTWVLNLLFRAGISDAHCGMRSLTAAAARSLGLRTTGMEFASEMIIQAARRRLRIAEVPITLSRGGRPGKPHLRSFRDGWRHLKMMFMLSPTHLFLWPGGVLLAAGLALMVVTARGPLYLRGVLFDYHWMILGSLLAVLGFGILNIGFFARVFALAEGFEAHDPLLERLAARLRLEHGLALGTLMALLGLAIDVRILVEWIRLDFSFGGEVRIRPALVALTLIVLGVQIVFSSFFYGILRTERRPR
jgi:glycosyltransferase involved in cell wall biosynthesis